MVFQSASAVIGISIKPWFHVQLLHTIIASSRHSAFARETTALVQKILLI